MDLPWILLFILLGLYFVTLPFLFKRAGKPSWQGAVPILNFYVWLRLINRPWYWLLLLLVPGVNLLMLAIMNVELGIAFNQRSAAQQWYFGALPWIAITDLAFRKKEVAFVGPRDWTNKKKSMGREWGEAILFAVVAASVIRTFFFEAFTIPTPSMEGSMLVGDYLFVSKLSYGPKLPMTPVSVPFIHNAMPGSMTNSYVDWFSLPYFRLPGLGKVERYDPLVFNFPQGDTIIVDPVASTFDYYQIIRHKAINLAGSMEAYLENPWAYEKQSRQFFTNQYGIKKRPLDKQENYIKRVVALPGETIEIQNRQVIIDGQAVENPPGLQYNYLFRLKNEAQLTLMRDRLKLTDLDFGESQSGSVKKVALTDSEYAQLLKMDICDTIVAQDQSRQRGTLDVFPNSMMEPYRFWDADNFGPVYIPAKGGTIQLNIENLPLYRRAIESFEGNEVRVEGETIFLNGTPATEYTFNMNYYWLMGDNRHNSLDARFWGFVPETHVVGKAVFTWFSKANAQQQGEDNAGIRWNRMFKTVK
jgi:signal peptidase I